MSEIGAVVSFVTFMAIITFGFLLIIRGRDAFSGLRGVSLVSGIGAIGSLGLQGSRMLAFSVAAGAVSVAAAYLQYRLRERRERKLMRGTAETKKH